MKKNQREVESLLSLFKECFEVEAIIDELPRGYISVKVISGHTYNYRQWREGSKILSEYVPNGYLGTIKRKIATRKEYENTLKDVKKELRAKIRYVLRHEILTQEEIDELKEEARG